MTIMTISFSMICVHYIIIYQIKPWYGIYVICKAKRSAAKVCTLFDGREGISVPLSLCQSVSLVSRAKTAEKIKLPFGFRTWLGPLNHVLQGPD